MSKFESEIVAMTASMLNGDAVQAVNPDDEVCGTVTSGGTESILMAMKVYRDRAFKEKGITKPEIIKPKTAHPSFSKAGQYFGIKVVEVETNLPDFCVEPTSVEERINENTIAIVGSAGNYPYGQVDPCYKLSELAVKYGFGRKGTSVVLYRNKTLRRYQYFDVSDFSGGIYVSPSFHVNDFMKTRGWRFNVLQLPPALHFCVTMPQTQVPDVAGCLIEDLKSGVEYARSKAGTVAETTALYGMAGTMEGNQMVSELLSSYLDHFYTV